MDSSLHLICNKVRNFPYLPIQLIFALDLMFAALCYFVSVYIRFSLLNESLAFEFFFSKLSAFLVVTGCFFYIFNTSSEPIRFSTCRVYMRIFLSLLCSHIFVVLLFSTYPDFFSYSPYSEIAAMLSFLLSVNLILFFRMAVRIFFSYTLKSE